MRAGYVFLAGDDDVAGAVELAAQGYLLVPMSPSASACLADAAIPFESVADSEVQRAFAGADGEAEAMTDELLTAMKSRVPAVFDYEGLDAEPALFQGILEAIAGDIAFARCIASAAAERMDGQARAVVGGGPLAPVVGAVMHAAGVAGGHLDANAAEPATQVTGGSFRTVLRDLPLLAKRAPARLAARRPRVALVATAPTHPLLSRDVLAKLQRDVDVEIYGCGFDAAAPEGLSDVRIGRLDEYAVRSIGTLRRRARHYRAIVGGLDAVLADLDKRRWDGAGAMVATRLPVTVDRVGYYAEQCMSFTRSAAPDLVMMMDEKSMLGRVMTRACAAAGIPTLDAQHGMLWASPSLRGVDYSKLCVFGGATRDALVECGVDPAHIEVTGCPRFDALAQAKPASRDDVVGSLGLDPARPVVLAATQPIKFTITPRAKHDFVLGLVQSARAGHGQVIIKKHPYETDDIVERLTSGVDGIAVTTAGDLTSLISVADVVTTIHSTVALEALIVGRPVVVFRPPDMPELVPYCSEGAADIARDIAQLSDVLASAVAVDPKTVAARREAFLNRHILLDGRSAERIAKMALALVARD